MFDFEGDPKAGDTVTITVRDRSYSYTLTEEDVVDPARALLIMRNILVRSVNAGVGDSEVTARVLQVVGSVRMQIVARSHRIRRQRDTLQFRGLGECRDRGRYESRERLPRRRQHPAGGGPQGAAGSRAGNDISYSAQGTVLPENDPTTPDVNERAEADNFLTLRASGTHLCCGNEPFAPITPENPVIPGELIIVFGTDSG